MLWKVFKKLRIRFSGILASPLFQSLLLVFLLLYAAVLTYYYQFFGLGVVTWHTHLLFPAFLFFGLQAFLFLLFKTSIVKDFNKWREQLLYYCWLLFFIELIIWVTGIAKVEYEDMAGKYMHQSNVYDKSYYHVWKSGSTHLLAGPEFSHLRQTNSLGFADYEWIKEKPYNTIRILCLGDSFTEGDAAHYDSSYVSFLRRSIQKKYPQIEVMNAGSCGSDPFFNFVNLRDRLIQYQPDIIVQTYSSNDLFNDYGLRGGMERFQRKDYLSYPKFPWWEPIYAVSYVFRIFARVAGYNNDLTLYKGTDEEKNTILQVHATFFKEDYQAFAKEHGLQWFLCAFPMRNELRDKRYEFNQPAFQDSLRKEGIRAYDLLSCYSAYLKTHQGNYADFFWQIDAHHNAKGYQMMANCIEQIISPVLDSITVGRANLIEQAVN